MRTNPKITNLIVFSIVGVILLLGFGPVSVSAYNSDMVLARAKYPHIVGTRLDTCNLCHEGLRVLNPYGEDYWIHFGDPDPFDSIEGLDSDGDGFTNIEEIQAFAFPGDPNDPSLPEAPTLLSPPNGSVTTEPSVVLTWQENLIGGYSQGYHVQLDGTIVTTTLTTSATVLSMGVHTWTVRAYNLAGTSNWATPAWTVEIVAPLPDVPILLSPTDGAVTTTHAITFSWQAGGNEPVDGYELSVDGDGVTTTATTMPVVLDTGVHTWTVRAYNGAGHSDWASPARTVEITETFAPGVPILLSPPDGTVTTTRAITLTWQAGPGAAPEGYNLRVDQTVVTPTSGGTALLPLLDTGVHTWTARAYNAGGYSDWAAPWTVEIRDHQVYLPSVLCDY